MLGVADARLLQEAFDAVGAGDASRALLALDRVRASRAATRAPSPPIWRARAGAADRPDAGRGAGRALPHARVRRASGRAGRARRPRRRRTSARAAGRGDGGDPRRRRRAHPARAGAREGRKARGRQLDARAAGPDRATGSGLAPAAAVAAQREATRRPPRPASPPRSPPSGHGSSAVLPRPPEPREPLRLQRGGDRERRRPQPSEVPARATPAASAVSAASRSAAGHGGRPSQRARPRPASRRPAPGGRLRSGVAGGGRTGAQQNALLGALIAEPGRSR